MISQGGISGTITDIRMIFQTVLKANGVALILAHYYPSGNLNPLETDKKTLRKSNRSGNYLTSQFLITSFSMRSPTSLFRLGMCKFEDMGKTIILLTVLCIVFSCSFGDNAEFKITNSSNERIDSISIKTSEESIFDSFISIESGETSEYYIDMTDLPTVEGQYSLSFKRASSDSFEIKDFGYFTNGNPLEKLIRIFIEQDSVRIEQVFDNY